MEGGLGDALSDKVRAHLANAVERQELIGAPVDEKGVKVRAVLNGSVDLGRKRRRVNLPGAGATFDFGKVFGDVQSQSRQIKDLPFLMSEDLDSAQRAAATARAIEQGMRNNAVRILNEG